MTNGKVYCQLNADVPPLAALRAARLPASGCQHLFIHTQSVHRVYTLCCIMSPRRGFITNKSVSPRNTTATILQQRRITCGCSYTHLETSRWTP